MRIFLRSEVTGQLHGCFTVGEIRPGTVCIGGLVYPRDCLDDVENRKFLTLPRIELQPLGLPSHGCMEKLTYGLCKLGLLWVDIGLRKDNKFRWKSFAWNFNERF
jgi:hypothetical protein